MKKETSMVEYQKNKKDVTRARVEDMIRKIKRNKTPITKSEFCKRAEITIQYLYKYPDLNAEVNRYCKPTGKKVVQSVDSKDSIIVALRAENKRLKEQLAEFQKDEKYKTKYDEAQNEIKKLKQQLATAYASTLDDNF